MIVESREPGDRIHGRHHAVQRVDLGQCAVRHQRMQDRCRISEAAGLDHDALERRHRAGSAARGEIAKGQHQVAAHIAAQAAVRELDKTLVAAFDQLVIKPYRAEFVDDDRGARHRGIAQQASQQRRLAAAQKTGDDGNWNHVAPTPTLPR